MALAASLMITNTLLPIVGFYTSSYRLDPGPIVRAGGVVLTSVQILIIAIAVVLVLAIHSLLVYT